MDRIGIDQDNAAAFESDASFDLPPVIDVSERRLQVRAYNYWSSLLNGRQFPAVTDLEPSQMAEFSPHSVLIDFARDSANPRLAFVGNALREEGGADLRMGSIGDIPAGSLLSRITDHYVEIIANRAPIGFEAEFVNQRGHETMYRGILLPLASNGESIDYIYGVVNWKELAEGDVLGELEQLAARDIEGDKGDGVAPSLWAVDAAPTGLPDQLAHARASADAAREADGRSRAALYAALSDAYDFALAALDDAEGYAELLEDAGLTVQARAPMTPLVKLVFGVAYDKTRITEFAAALGYARRIGVAESGFGAWIAAFPGGLKGAVKAAREERRKDAPAKPKVDVRAALRHRAATVLVSMDIPAGDDEYVLLIARREQDGQLAVLAPVTQKPIVDRALNSLA